MSPFFLPAAGNRNNATGATYNVGRNGNFWVSRPNSATNGFNLNFNSGNLNTANANNARNGFGVRCLPQELALFSSVAFFY